MKELISYEQWHLNRDAMAELYRKKDKKMNTFYIVVASTSICKGNWGKGTSLKSALNLCKVRKLSESFVIYQAIIKDTATKEQVENLCKCFNVNDLGGVCMYSNPTKEDLDMVTEYLLGWITNEDFIK